MARHIYTYINPTSERDLLEACRVLDNDGILAYPTDVNWALGCNAASKKAINKLYVLKAEHPKGQAFSLLCDSLSMVASVAYIENFAYRIIRRALPGPYTFLLQRNHDLPRKIKDMRKVVGIRIPDSPLLLDLIRMFGKPLITTSMPPGPAFSEGDQQYLTFGYQINEAFGHAIDLILDLGEEIQPDETTIIDLSTTAIKIIRQGKGLTAEFESIDNE